MPTIANITVTIAQATDFHPLISGSTYLCTPASLAMATLPGVWLTGTAPEQTLHVTVPANLIFAFAPGSGYTEYYYPVGLALRNEAGGGVNPQQRAMFPNQQITNSGGSTGTGTLTLTDNDNDPTNNCYDFYIMIQRGSDGALGLIDPRLSNT